jgi:hypothetical protein
MGNMPVSKNMQERIGERPGKRELDAVRMAANLLFPANDESPASQRREMFSDNPDRERSPGDGD